MARASFKNYGKNTPILYKKIGDAVLILGTTLTATFAGMEMQKEWIIAAALLTAFGKIITNFFIDEENKTI